ncbi:unnamed protein product [Brassica napus]|uniref:(rape) hypothetical protein n=1 Tax=Brassica napus TaxID=3708 RepID=A0A817APX9_BRANA|nr:unnamed protein product [Brassica napus]
MATNSSNGTTTKSPPMPSPLRNSKFLQSNMRILVDRRSWIYWFTSG